MKKILLLSMLTFLSMPIHTNPMLQFQQVLTIDEGLSQNSINQIEEDSKGYLWLGTQSGLNRWNGIELEKYPSLRHKAFPNGPVSLIHKDYRDRLWVQAGDGNLYIYDDQQESFQNTGWGETIFGSPIVSIIDDSARERILLSSQRGRLYQWEYPEKSPQLLLSTQQAVTCSFSYWQYLCLGTQRGWKILEGKELVNKTLPWMHDKDLPVYDVLYQNGILYTARGNSGVTLLYPGSDHAMVHLEIEAHKISNTGKQDILISNTKSNELLLLDSQSNEIIHSTSVPFHTNVLKNINNTYIAVGTEIQGLWFYDPYSLVSMKWPSAEQSYGSAFQTTDVISAIEDANQSIWMILYEEGILKWNPETKEEILFTPQNSSLPTAKLRYIYRDQNNYLWLCSKDKGIFYLNPENLQFQYPPMDLQWNEWLKQSSINHIEEIDRNRFWISSEQGLFFYNKENSYIKELKKDFYTLGNPCKTTLMTRDGSLWIASELGIFRLENNSLSSIYKSNATFLFLYQDSKDFIYASSPSSLKIFNEQGDPISFPILENAVLRQSVYAIQEDQEGKLWITTNQGIVIFDRDQGKIITLDKSKGLLNREYNFYSIGQRQNGSLYFGGLEGLQIISTYQEIPYEPTSHLFLKQIEIDQKPLNFSPEIDKMLTLTPGRHNIALYYELIQFHQTDPIQIEYRVQGIIDEWTNTSGQKTIHLFNMPPGQYLFQIQTRTAMGVLSKPVELPIGIPKPYYQRWWFFSLMGFILILIVSLIAWYIHYQKKEVNKRRLAERRLAELTGTLEEQIISRTEELEKALTQLKQAQQQVIQQEKMSSLGQVVAGVSHEINTPLGVAVLSNSIILDKINFLNQEIEKGTLTREDLEETLEDLNQAAERLGYNLDRSASLVKNFKQVAVEKNQKDLIEFDLVSSIKSLLNSLHNEFKRHNVTLTTHFPPMLNIHSYPGDISQVITNILMNSIIHGFGEGFDKEEKIIALSLLEEKNDAYLRIRDNGVGIPKEHIDQIFDPFFTTNRKKGGTGLGLNIVYNIIQEKLKGEISVESNNSMGTEFMLKIPLISESP